MKTEEKVLTMMDEKTIKKFQKYIEMWTKDMEEAAEGTSEDIDQTVLLVIALALYFKEFVKIAKKEIN